MERGWQLDLMSYKSGNFIKISIKVNVFKISKISNFDIDLFFCGQFKFNLYIPFLLTLTNKI